MLGLGLGLGFRVRFRKGCLLCLRPQLIASFFAIMMKCITRHGLDWDICNATSSREFLLGVRPVVDPGEDPRSPLFCINKLTF